MFLHANASSGVEFRTDGRELTTKVHPCSIVSTNWSYNCSETALEAVDLEKKGTCLESFPSCVMEWIKGSLIVMKRLEISQSFAEECFRLQGFMHLNDRANV